MRLPLLFSIIGAFTGFLVSRGLIYGAHDYKPDIDSFLFALVLSVSIFVFIWRKQSAPKTLKALMSISIILFGMTYWFTHNDYQHIHSISPLFYFLLILVTLICTAFIQSWQQNKPHWVYADLFENAWNNQFFILFSALLTGGFLAVLALGTLLFDSIGIKVSDFIWTKEVAPILTATLAGAGIGIAREHSQIIFKIRNVFFALFRVMAYLAAVIVILFSLSLPFSLDSLFQNKNTSFILLSVVAISILLLNTLVDTYSQDEQTKLSAWQNRIFGLQIILLPLLSLLSIYAISLRLLQHGAMPKRIVALTIAILLTFYGIAYLYQLVTRKSEWIKGLTIVNPPLAIIWIVVLMSLASPILDPVRISVNNQVSRLENNTVSPEKFDFYALHNLGKRGKDAIETMRTWENHPQFSLIKENIDSRGSYRRKRNLFVSIIGEQPEHIDLLIKNIGTYRCNEETPCFIKQVAIEQATNNKAVFLFSFKHSVPRADLYTYDKNWWNISTIFTDDNSENIERTLNKEHIKKQKEKIQSAIKALKNNQIKTIKPLYFDLELGDFKLRQHH